MIRITLSALLILLGLILAAGGVWLATVGGSWFYILLGAAVVASGGLVLARNPLGLGLYGVAIFVTLAWAIWEVGFDWWALAPRGGLLVVLGLLLLLPWVVHGTRRHDAPPSGYGANSAVLTVSLAVAALVGVYAMFQSPHEISGTFAEHRMGEAAEADEDIPAGEWHAYGRTQAGQRYSPLSQITPDNVSGLKVAWTYQTGQVRGEDDPGETTYEVTPLKIDDKLYLCTPFGTVVALNPETGAEIWSFDPQLQQPPSATTQHLTCRGLAYSAGAATAEQPVSATEDEADVTGTPASETDVAEEEEAQIEQQAATPEGESVASALAQAEIAPEDEPKIVSEELSPEERLQRSVAEVTQDAAGVPQNVITEQAEHDEPNPRVNRETVLYTGSIPDVCEARLFYAIADGRLMSISAETGELCPGFGGADGTVDLWANMPNITPGSIYSTSPPVVTENAVIVGGAINDNVATTSPSGVIRAYDIDTGELLWNFDSKRPDAVEPIANDETYTENSPNSWSVSSYDPELGLIFLPMGNQSPDQFGGNRSEEVERFSSSVLALDAETGEVAWVFQTVHHDIWDYDMPAQPSLLDLTIEGETMPALVVPTKQGDIYVLYRETGEPILPVEDVSVPQGAVEGDTTAPTQPTSAISFKPEPLTGADMWGATLIDQLFCRIRFQQLDYRGRFTPPSQNGTIVYPGNFGTFNWGAIATDPERQVAFAMPVYLGFKVKMVPRKDDLERVVTKEGDPVFNENFGAPYAAEMGPFYSPIGLPCQQPPWGYVAGIDLGTGETVYKHVNGTVRDLSPLPLPFEMGVPGIGGPIITGGGVAFLSGTMDYYVRGYDLRTGEEIWRDRLPAGGQATPMTYEGADGRQYLVVVAGGHGSTGTKAGDSIVAYALGD